MKYTNRADLLIAAGESIKMQEKAGINLEPVCKWAKNLNKISAMKFDQPPHEYEFPIAVVEGKAVFVGDELWYSDICVVASSKNTMTYKSDNFVQTPAYWHHASWNPPKPKTVLIELPYDFVKEHAEFKESFNSKILTDACRKAMS